MNDIKRKTGVDVVVQFYPWLNFFFSLYFIVSKTLINDSGNGLLALENTCTYMMK